MFRVLALLVANLSVCFFAWGVASRFAQGGALATSLRGLCAVLLRVLVLSAAVLVAGIAGRLDPAGLLALTLAPSLLLFATCGLPPRPALRALLAAWGGPFVAAAGLVGLKLVLQAWAFAPANGDVLSYHLPKVAEWVRAGAFVRQLGVDSHASFPAGFELVEAFWAAFLHHDVLIEFAGLEFGVLAFAAVSALGVWLGLSSRSSAWAALLFVLTPTFQLQLTSCLNDAAVTALLLTSAALLVHAAPWGLVLCALGLAVGVKPVAAYALPGLVLLALLVRREGARPVRSESASWMAVTALITGGAWYARNWAWFGNPVHPMGTSGVLETGGFVTIQFGPSLAGLWQNVGALFGERLLDAQEPLSALSRSVAGWGAVSVAVGVPALLLQVREDIRLRWLAGALAVSAASVLLLVKPDLWFARFVMFLAAPLVLAAARASATSRVVKLFTALGAVLAVATTLLPGELPGSQARQLWAQPWRERSMARVLEADGLPSRVGYYADNYGEAYVLYGPGFEREVVYLRALEPTALRDELRAAGIDTLYSVPGTAQRLRVIEAAVEQGLLERVRGRVYRLRAERP